MRVFRPILRSLYPAKIWSALTEPFSGLFNPAPNTVAVTSTAEQAANNWIQITASQLVWAIGCNSWHVDARTGRNTMLIHWQCNYWLRSVSILLQDFVLGRSLVQLPAKGNKKPGISVGIADLWVLDWGWGGDRSWTVGAGITDRP
jgi:hypothetical protein